MKASSLLSRAIRPQFQQHHGALRCGRLGTLTNAGRQIQRAASTVAADARSVGTRTKNLVLGSFVIVGIGAGYFYVTDTRSSVHRWLVVPALRHLLADAEDAHEAGTHILRALHDFGLHPRERGPSDVDRGDLTVEVFGHVLQNPIGTSAGIDKHADIPSALLELGPAIVEIGGATPHPQSGNPKPRVFRIPSQNALINRYGLNSEGAEHMAMKLRQRVRRFARAMGYGTGPEAEQAVLDGGAGVPPGSLVEGKLLAVQVAKNKTTPDSDIDAVRRDYVFCVDALARYADIIVVNVSSPNTPGLRALQATEPLQHILTGVVDAARATARKTKPAVMVKVSPDEDSEAQVRGICHAVWASGVDGVIVGNTTKKRPAPLPAGYVLPDRELAVLEREDGGYSGPQMFERTLDLVRKYRKVLDEAVHANPDKALASKTIFATGGITNGAQALQVLNAGASLAMVYTALVYGGVGTVTRIKDEMRAEMRDKPAEKPAVAAKAYRP